MFRTTTASTARSAALAVALGTVMPVVSAEEMIDMRRSVPTDESPVRAEIAEERQQQGEVEIAANQAAGANPASA